MSTHNVCFGSKLTTPVNPGLTKCGLRGRLHFVKLLEQVKSNRSLLKCIKQEEEEEEEEEEERESLNGVLVTQQLHAKLTILHQGVLQECN